jgi:phosphate acetyltransferase
VNLFESIKQHVRPYHRRILLAETGDERVIEAAARIQREDFCRVVLLGDAARLAGPLKRAGGDPDGIEFLDPADAARQERIAREYWELRKAKGCTPEEARRTIASPVFYGSMCVRLGLVDGMTAGSASPTAPVIRAALQCVGLRPGLKTLSSCFLVVLPFGGFGHEGVLLFSDCGVVPMPTEDQLVDIARSAAASWRQFTGTQPVVALLSFSTKGSAKHEAAAKMAAVAHRVRELEPGLIVDGELQADAALVPEVASLKAPGSPVGGRANVLIFPDLASGNIGYKLVERLGRAQAVGPIFQGLARPINDLSRGCQVQSIVDAVAITAAQTFKG